MRRRSWSANAGSRRRVAAFVLGSGLGAALGDALRVEVAIRATATFRASPRQACPGTRGNCGSATLAGVPVAAFSGRFHLYEGHGPDVPALVAACGSRARRATRWCSRPRSAGWSPELRAGTVVLVRDHLNVMGAVPLAGWRYPGRDARVRERRRRCTTRPSARSRWSARPRWTSRSPRVCTLRCAVPRSRRRRRSRCSPELGGTVVGMSMVPEALPAPCARPARARYL